MKLLSFERRWAREVGRSFVPVDALAGTTAKVDPGAELSVHLSESPWTAAIVMRLALWVVWLSPLFVLGRPRTFGGLDEPAREAALEKLLASSLFAVREMLMLLRLSFCLVLLGNDSVMMHLDAYGVARERGADRSAS